MELLIIVAAVSAVAGLGGAAAVYVICMRSPRPRQVAPRLAPENRVEGQRHVLDALNGDGLNGVHERLPAGEGEAAVRIYALEPPLSPFEPLSMNPTYFLVSAILIFFVFSLLIHVVIRAAKTLLCTNHFVRIH